MSLNANANRDFDPDARQHVVATRERRAEALVNPASGLTNDYLNLFNEIVMLVEHLPTMPELIDDILRWRPVSYQDYFTASNLPGRTSALEAYSTLESRFRIAFESVVADLDRKAVGTVAAIRRHHRSHGDRQPEVMATLCVRAGESMRDVLSKATDLVNHGCNSPRQSAQMRADRVLGAGLHKAG